MIRWSPNDDKNAIHAIAGESNDAESKIRGLHTKKIIVIIDEADNKYSESIWTAIANLGTSGDLQVIGLSNPTDKTSRFGLNCEPINGPESVHPDIDFEWESTTGYHILRLDGLNSPNIILKEDKYPYLLTNKGMRDIIQQCGPNSLEYWAQVRAWFPPEGAINTIFNEEILNKTKITIVWYSDTFFCAALDPAFDGGDRCVLQIGKYGRLVHDANRFGIELIETITIQRKNMDVDPGIDFADQVIAICKERQVDPENFIMDSTGSGTVMAGYIKLKWSPKINPLSFGGSPTEMKISGDDSEKACDKFDRFVSELWYVAREWCRLGLVHIKSISRDLRIELQARRYKLKGGTIISIESKDDMKGRGLKSPDEADSFVLLVHLTRMKAKGFIPGTVKDKVSNKQFMHKIAKRANIYDATYSED
jgi:hypothetical protein